jgi:RNA polymerase sigma-70 factor (ECF subfamily)
MDADSTSRTSPTLLGQLRQTPTDQKAWAEFVKRYGPRIYGWCRRWNLQEADADDVTQMVLTTLAQKMSSFSYDPARRFRAWLKTIAQHAWSDFLASRQRAGRGSGDSQVNELLQTVEARKDLVARLEAEFDQELLEEALMRARLRVEPHTFEAFRLTAVNGMSGADAARQLGLPIATIFKAKSRVRKLVQAELQRLESAGESDS